MFGYGTPPPDSTASSSIKVASAGRLSARGSPLRRARLTPHGAEPTASNWTRTLGPTANPSPRRAFELAVTLAPFVGIWALAWWMLPISSALATALALANAAFLVRLFMIRHDCGHGSLLRSRRLCDWIGRVIGVVTLTPYDVRRRTHAIHHVHNAGCRCHGGIRGRKDNAGISRC